MISIIIPFHNEEKNIPLLVEEIRLTMEKKTEQWEVILVDDGSTMSMKLPSSSFVKSIVHNKRMGKGEALKSGLKISSGEMIVFMDGDLQDDPTDLPKFIEKMSEGYDLVNGIRTHRKDTGIVKTYSRYANTVLRSVFQSPFTDINCGFKMFRRTVLDDMPLYGNNFRFLPLSAYYRGFKVGEVPVHNRKRVHGVSKFGSMKLFVGLLDMTTAYFVFKFAERPLHFFGTIGASFFGFGFLISAYLAIERLLFNVLLYRRPVLWLGILLMIIGVQVLMTGLIGELIVYLHIRKRT